MCLLSQYAYSCSLLLSYSQCPAPQLKANVCTVRVSAEHQGMTAPSKVKPLE